MLALLTFPEDVCRADLLSDHARAMFDHVMTRAERLELPLPPELTREILLASPSGPGRDRQYQFAGLLLARYCSLLVALWDGKPTAFVAGSARVVEFRQLGSRQQGDAGHTDVLLDAADNDLMFEIRCARESDAAAVAAQPPIDIRGFSGEDVEPLNPVAMCLNCRRRWTGCWRAPRSSTAIQWKRARASQAHAWPLIPPERQSPPLALQQLNQLFVQADYLGSFFRQRFLSGIKRRYLMWASMATLLIAFGGGYAEGIRRACC